MILKLNTHSLISLYISMTRRFTSFIHTDNPHYPIAVPFKPRSVTAAPDAVRYNCTRNEVYCILTSVRPQWEPVAYASKVSFNSSNDTSLARTLSR